MSLDALPRADELLLTVDEVCARLKVGRSTVYELVKNKQLKSVTIGRARRFRPADVAQYVQSLHG